MLGGFARLVNEWSRPAGNASGQAANGLAIEKEKAGKMLAG